MGPTEIQKYIDLVKNSNFLPDQEKKFWEEKIPLMSPDQLVDLENLLASTKPQSASVSPQPSARTHQSKPTPAFVDQRPTGDTPARLPFSPQGPWLTEREVIAPLDGSPRFLSDPKTAAEKLRNLEGLSSFTLEDFLTVGEGITITGILSLVKRHDKLPVRLVMEQTPFYRSYLQNGALVLAGGAAAVITKQEFEQIADLLRIL